MEREHSTAAALETNTTVAHRPESRTGRVSWVRQLFQPIPITPLVYFRIAFGAIMFWEVWRYFKYGWIQRIYIDPPVHFKYFGFEWVRPWPGDGMYLHLLVIGILALCVAIGLWYRWAAALFFLGFTYVFLLDEAQYLNHLYLVCLVSFLMIFIPAHRALSFDAWRNPALRSATAPLWALWLLRLQVAIPYFYGGIAKLNLDWLRGEPIRSWLGDRLYIPVITPLLGKEFVVMVICYGGLLLDLLVVPMLLWRRTRLPAMAAMIAFHLSNAFMFRIGIFPWFMIAATMLYLPIPWWHRIQSFLSRDREGTVEGTASPLAGARGSDEAPPARHRALTLALLGAWAAFQLLFPLRHFLYPGVVHWTEEGHRFSWHMKLRSKDGWSEFLAHDPVSNQTWIVEPLDFGLTPKQIHRLGTQPDMILQFSHIIAEELRRDGYPRIEVRAEVETSLNGRRPQLLIDPQVNLAEVKRSLWPAKWIVPLHVPLNDRASAETQPADEEAGGASPEAE